MFSNAFYMKWMFTQDNIYLSFEKLIEEFDKEFIASGHSLFALLQKNIELEGQLENHFDTLKKDDLIEFLEFMNIHISLDIKLRQHELDQALIHWMVALEMNPEFQAAGICPGRPAGAFAHDRTPSCHEADL